MPLHDGAVPRRVNTANYEDCVLTDDKFNEAIGAWDTSLVTDMSSTFTDATAFNADIGDWDVSQVTVMYRALAFFARFLRVFWPRCQAARRLQRRAVVVLRAGGA